MKREIPNTYLVRLLIVLPLMAGMVLVSACHQNAKRRSPQAEHNTNIYVGAFPGVPWEKVKEGLKPKLGLSIEEACKMADQTTQSAYREALRAVGIGAMIGLRGISDVSVRELDEDGTLTKTETKTRSTGEVPESSGAGSVPIDSDTLTFDSDSTPSAGALEASSRLDLCVSLYQKAKLLEEQLAQFKAPSGYRAHLVTLRLDVQPGARDLGADSYTTVSFFPSNASAVNNAEYSTAKPPPVVVYPLLATDTFESRSASQISEAIRQAALEIGGVVSQIGLAVGGNRSSSNLDAITGRDTNSLISVGRVTDSTVRIRIGAQYQATNEIVMVPRSFNVSFVVVSRWDESKKDGGSNVNGLSAVSHTEIYDLANEKISKKRNPSLLAQDVVNRVNTYGYGSSFNCDCRNTQNDLSVSVKKEKFGTPFYECIRPDTKKLHIDPYLQLLRSVDFGDYQGAAQCLGSVSNTISQPDYEWEKMRRLFSDLLEIEAYTRSSTMLIPFPKVAKPLLPASYRTIVVSEKEDTHQFQVTVNGGKLLSAHKLIALLQPSRFEGEVSATSITVNDDATSLTLIFPKTSAATKLYKPKLRLCWMGASGRCKSGAMDQEYRYSAIVPADKKKPSADKIRTPQSVVVMDHKGNGEIVVQAVKVPVEEKLYVSVTGAIATPKGSGVPMSVKGVAFKSDGVIAFSLSNLSASRDVVITPLNEEGKSSGNSITLRVEKISSVSTSDTH